MSAKIYLSITVDPALASRLDAAILAEAGTGAKVTRTSFIREALEARLVNVKPLPRRARATVAPSAV